MQKVSLRMSLLQKKFSSKQESLPTLHTQVITKKTEFDQLMSTGKYISSSAHSRKDFCKKLIRFGDSICKLLRSQNADIEKEEIDEIIAKIKNLSNVYHDFSKSENRSGQDLCDIAERYVVLCRANSDYYHCGEMFKKKTSELEALIQKNESEKSKPGYEKKKGKLEAGIKEAEESKKAALKEYISSVRTLIDCKNRFNLFMKKRYEQGWKRYGLALGKMCDNEEAALNDVKDVLVRIRSSIAHETPIIEDDNKSPEFGDN